MRVTFLLLVALALGLGRSAEGAEKVSLQLRWDHQFQFAGYYAALWQGYYAAEGIEVDIRSALRADGSVIDAIEAVRSGAADFGIGAADILVGNERGPKLTVLASIFQTSGAALYARADTPLERPVDLLPLRMARKPGDLVDVEVRAMLRVEGIDPDRISTVPLHATTLNDLGAGLVDAIPGYGIALPLRAKELGIAVRELRPASYGIDFYGDSLFTQQATAHQRPALTDAFLAASLRGWRYAFDHAPELAARIARELPIVRTLPDPLAYNLAQAEGMRRLVRPEQVAIGHMNPVRWGRMAEVMRDSGQLRQMPESRAPHLRPGAGGGRPARAAGAPDRHHPRRGHGEPAAGGGVGVAAAAAGQAGDCRAGSGRAAVPRLRRIRLGLVLGAGRPAPLHLDLAAVRGHHRDRCRRPARPTSRGAREPGRAAQRPRRPCPAAEPAPPVPRLRASAPGSRRPAPVAEQQRQAGLR